ncbi:MAG TPA: DUF2207 domain-containing protein, partial [Gaiellaceae bacterium]|nr:DUF2207 domain-containing protein [Gaiellaceae bacterium]
MLRRGLLALAAVALLWPASAAAKSYSLPAAHVGVRIQPDGSLLVRERITFDFSGFFSGAYRDIPLRSGESIGDVSVAESGQSYRPGGNTKLGSYDTPGTFGVTQTDHVVRIVWHYSATDEPRTFDVSYRFRGLAVAHDDVVDVNLRVWGDQWPAGLGALRATMRLPRATSLGPSYRVWGSPAWVHGVVERTPEATLLRAIEIPSHQFVELRTVFPRSLLASTAGTQVRRGQGLPGIVAEELGSQRSFEHDRKQIDDAKRHIGRTILYLLLLGLGPALALVLVVWWFFGRERKTGYDREYEQEPPAASEPALVPPLLREQKEPGSNEFTATLFDLIRRGRYKSEPATTPRPVWGGLRHEEVADLEVTEGDRSVQLADFEEPVADVVDAVLDGGGGRLSQFRDRIEDDRKENSERFTSFKDRVEKAIDARGWFVGTGSRILAAGIVLFGVAGVLLLWIGVEGFRSAAPRWWSDVVTSALGVCGIANAIVLIAAAAKAPLWRRRSRTGEAEAERWEAFRRYLTDFPRLQEA